MLSHNFLGRSALALVLSTWMGLAAAATAAAPVDTRLTRLYADKRWGDALAMIETELASKPGDVAMQIQKGVVLSNLNRGADALVLFRKVATEHPELPEAHNNLAVLLAARGEFDQAREALDRAMRTSPSYATAHDNLGDLYAHMASDAYRKALRYDKQPASDRPKLAMVDGLSSPSGVVVAPAPKPVRDLTPPAPVRPAVSVPAPPAAAAASAKTVATALPAPKPPASAVIAKPPAAVASAPLLAAKPAPSAASAVASTAAPARPAASTTVTPAPADAGEADQREVAAAISAWAAAWSRRDMAAYVAAYAADFKGRARSHAAWKSERDDRISAKKNIAVAVSNLKIKVKGSHAEVQLTQVYEAGALRSVSQKSLSLEKIANRWVIQQESGR